MGTVDKQLLDLLKQLKDEDGNEASTRLKIIDQVIFDVLGWQRVDVEPETRVSEDGTSQITDYLFRTATTLFVIEAKRIGKEFQNVSGKRRFLLSDTNLFGEFGKAVRQARDFCRARGIPFAVVTNGDAWFIFPAVRNDGVSFSASSGVFFESLDQILLFDRNAFEELLSRNAVIDRSLDRAFLGTVENQIEQRRLNAFFESSTPRLDKENVFSLVEEEFLVALNPDIASQDVDLLKDAYVETQSRVRFDRRIQMHIRRGQNVTSKSTLRPLKAPGGATTFVERLRAVVSRARPLAILVLGPVGAGKTTFLEYVRNISAAGYLEKKADQPYPQWLQIDFRDFSEQQNARSFIIERLFGEIQNEPFMSDYNRCVRHAFKREIDALFRGPLHLFQNDPAERDRQITAFLMEQFKRVEPYVLTILTYTASNAPIFLVADNVDQIEDETAQGKIFSEIMAIAHQCKLNLILSMRDATYVKNKATPTFDAFDFDPVAIDHPPVEAVLSKRFAVAEKLVVGKRGEFVTDTGIKFCVEEDMPKIVQMLRQSVLGTEIGKQIEVLATGDIRLALRMTREFLQYGYSATTKAFRIFSRTGQYQLPPHEALRAIMVGNQGVYKEAYSTIGNPFDARLNRTEFQLVRLFICAALVAHASEPSFQFVTGNEIFESCGRIGFEVDPSVRTTVAGFLVGSSTVPFFFYHHQAASSSAAAVGMWTTPLALSKRSVMSTVFSSRSPRVPSRHTLIGVL